MVLAVQVGTPVDFPNADSILHNVFSNFDGQVFDLHLYAAQTSRRVVFRRAGIARIFCNIHPTMDQDLKLPDVLVSEEGYTLVQHKNKFGQDYRPPPEDRTFYPGGRR